MKKNFLVFLHRKVLFLSCEAFYGACIFWKHVGIIYTVTFNLSLDYIVFIVQIIWESLCQVGR